jgi:hypothetical protein
MALDEVSALACDFLTVETIKLKTEIAYSYDLFGNSKGTIPSSPTNLMRFSA